MTNVYGKRSDVSTVVSKQRNMWNRLWISTEPFRRLLYNIPNILPVLQSYSSVNVSRMSTNAFVGAARSTAASGSLVYEGERAVHEYLQFHFGR